MVRYSWCRNVRKSLTAEHRRDIILVKFCLSLKIQVQHMVKLITSKMLSFNTTGVYNMVLKKVRA